MITLKFSFFFFFFFEILFEVIALFLQKRTLDLNFCSKSW